jgi:CBS domain-containing protein
MKIKDLMTTDPRTCHPNDSLNDCADIMWRHDCGVVPVVDDERRVVGMITDRDVCMAAYHEGKTLNELRVQNSMSRQIRACSPDDKVADAEQIMRTHQIRRLPVVDGANRLMGIVSLNDIARTASAEAHQRRREVTNEEVGSTLASISEPTSSQTQAG